MKWINEENSLVLRDEEGKAMAEVVYRVKGNNDLNIEHVYVNNEHRGKGLAGDGMEATVAYLRENNLKASATCPYAVKWFKKNLEDHRDVISMEFRD